MKLPFGASKPAAAVLIATALVVVLAALARVVPGQFEAEVVRPNLFAGLRDVGSACEAALVTDARATSYQELAATTAPFAAIPVPYKHLTRTGQLQIPTDGAIVVRCVVAPEPAFDRPLALLRLGKVMGPSAAFVDGALVSAQADDAVMAVALDPEKVRRGFELKVVSKRLADRSGAGLVSSDPAVIITDRAELSRVEYGFSALQTDVPALRLGFAVAFAAFFGAAWLFGLRQADVACMIVAATAFAAQQAAVFDPLLAYPTPRQVTWSFAEAWGNVALACFHLAFLGLATPWRRRLFALYLLLAGLYGVAFLTTALPPSPAYLFFRTTIPYGFAAVAFLVNGLVVLAALRTAPQRGRVGLLGTLCLVSGAGYAAQLYASLHGVVFAPYLKIVFLAIFAVWLATDLVVFRRRYLEEKAARLETERDSVRLKTVARTTQMLAHDVRKPFSLLRLTLRLIREAKDPDAVRDIAARFSTDVERSLTAVEGMVEDVMLVDRTAPQTVGRLLPETLVKSCFEDLLRLYPSAALEIAYDFRHREPLAADERRLKRVAMNILENAIQAMGGRGSLWIRSESTRLGSRSAVALVFGNGGSYIAEADRERIFEPFVTEGKAEGTGLGLAIVKQIVTEHGGTIRCDATREKGVEFIVTLPGAGAMTESEERAAQAAFDALPRRAGETASSHRARPGSTSAASGPQLAVVDDNIFIREAWQTLVRDAEVRTFASPEEFWRWTAAEPDKAARLSCVVTDFHFGDESDRTGADFAIALRRHGDVRILLASDSPVTVGSERLFDAVIDKEPQAWAELAALLSSQAPRAVDQ